MRVMKGSPLLTAPDTLMRPPSTALLNLLVLVPIDTWQERTQWKSSARDRLAVLPLTLA